MSQSFVLPSDSKSRSEIVNAVKEASNARTRIEGEREFIRETAKRIKEELGVPPAVFNQLVTTYHRQDVHDRQQRAEEFFEIYEVLFK